MSFIDARGDLNDNPPPTIDLSITKSTYWQKSTSTLIGLPKHTCWHHLWGKNNSPILLKITLLRRPSISQKSKMNLHDFFFSNFRPIWSFFKRLQLGIFFKKRKCYLGWYQSFFCDIKVFFVIFGFRGWNRPKKKLWYHIKVKWYHFFFGLPAPKLA